jgi:hypothetical protein
MKINYNRFKFRIYDFNAKRMTFLEDESMGFDLPAIIEECKKGNYALMQCTGFTDINNNLIYEGDLLEDRDIYENEDGEELEDISIHSVIFADGCFQFEVNKDKNNREIMTACEDNADFMKFDYKIIGNIYERK